MTFFFVRSFVPFARVWIELESLYTIHKDLFLFLNLYVCFLRDQFKSFRFNDFSGIYWEIFYYKPTQTYNPPAGRNKMKVNIYITD